MKLILLKLAVVAIMTCCAFEEAPAQRDSTKVLEFNKLSETFLLRANESKDTKEIQDQLARTSLKALEVELKTDGQKLAFWVNIYNAYIQVFLKENPDLYNDRGAFFNDDRITIAGELISFAKIEHGIIRKSQWPLGLGKIRKWFPNKFERKLRVDKRDYRVHFALNCGAKDCPPVAVYYAERLEEQFEKSTKMYLNKSTVYDATKKEVAVTSLFSWFRGDFGSQSDVKNILKDQGLIPETKNIDIIYKNYDWTLDLNNWIDL
jgi:hypothetical protein